MRTRYTCSLNGMALDGLDEAIYILDIAESPPAMHAETVARPLGSGSHVLRMERTSLSVRVSFAIREYDVARRKAVCSKVAAWACRGGLLTVGDRPDQRLRVRCTGLPVIASALRWTEALSVVFTAFEAPFWEAEQPVSVSAGASAAISAQLYVPGAGGSAWLDAELNCSGVATVTVATSLSSITLTGVSGTVRMHHDEGVLAIDGGGTSLLTHRTADSSDDLLVVPGEKNTIRVSSSGTVSAVFSTRGCFL